MRPPAALLAVVLLVAGCAVGNRPPSAAPRPTPEDAFWQTVGAARRAAGGNVSLMRSTLAAALGDADRPQLEAFERRLLAGSRRAYTWHYADAAELVCGYLGDDGFTDFRSWAIAQGKAGYDAYVAEPDSLADVSDVASGCEADGELFAAAVADRYADAGGVPGEDPGFPISEPTRAPRGKPLPRTAVRRAFPRLVARFPPRPGLRPSWGTTSGPATAPG